MLGVSLRRVLILFVIVGLFGLPGQAGRPRMLWIPLDSRPINTNEVALLGQAANLEVLLPPVAALDWYAEKRSDFPRLMAWLQRQSRAGDTQVLFMNNLLVGGLIASRDGALYTDLPARMADVRRLLQRLPSGKRIAVHVLPRILPTQFLPDGSANADFAWAELLAERSELLHRLAAAPTAADGGRLTQIERQIPAPVRQRYDRLLQANERALDQLLQLVADGLLTELIIGLDDARPHGMANLMQQRARQRAGALGIADRVQIHYGADEIGFLLVAREGLLRQGVRPSIQVAYGHPEDKELLLPYEGAPLGASVAQKLALLEAAPLPEANDRPAPSPLPAASTLSAPSRPQQVVFIHARPWEADPAAAEALALQAYLTATEGAGVTVVDVTSTGARDMRLLSELRGTVSLAAVNYAGWNTASNSVGTGLAMAAIAELHRQRAPSERQVVAMIAFRALRYSFDGLYLTLEPELNAWAEAQGIDRAHFGPAHQQMQTRLMATVAGPMQAMLTDLFGDALVEAKGRVRSICVRPPALSFPWRRTFEVRIIPEVTLHKAPPGRAPANCLRR